MKTNYILALLAIAASAGIVIGQEAGNGRPPEGGPPPDQQSPAQQEQGTGPQQGPRRGPAGRRHRPPPPLIIGALDANHDHVIDATEIANASAALLQLDSNGDGQLTIDEYMGPKPPGAPRDGRKPPLPLVVQALDANHDGIIDATEIANAPAVLKSLDKNGDGQLTPDEFAGPHPPPPGDCGQEQQGGP